MMQFVLQHKSWLPVAQRKSSGAESAVHVIWWGVRADGATDVGEETRGQVIASTASSLQ